MYIDMYMYMYPRRVCSVMKSGFVYYVFVNKSCKSPLDCAGAFCSVKHMSFQRPQKSAVPRLLWSGSVPSPFPIVVQSTIKSKSRVLVCKLLNQIIIIIKSIYTCTRLFICIFLFIYEFKCIFLGICIVYLRICVVVCIVICIFISIWLHVYYYVCTYVYLYVYSLVPTTSLLSHEIGPLHFYFRF